LEKYQFMAPDQANPYDSLGEIQAYSGHYDEAIANLKKALAIKPDFYESWGHLGVANEGKGDWTQAIQDYEHAAADAVNDDQRTGFLMSAFRVASFAKDLKEAHRIAGRVEALPRSKERDLNFAGLRAALALVEGRPADTERELDALRPQVESLFRKYAGEKEPFYQAGLNWLMAHAKLAQGKTDEAIALYRQMAEPPRPFASFPERRWIFEGRAELARILAERGDVDGAEKLLEANRRWNPSWAPSQPAVLAV